MSRWRPLTLFVSGFCLAAGLGCSHAPGKPGPQPEVVNPDQVLDFPTLYNQNCVACHGTKERPGPAIYIENPVYLAIAGRANIVQVLNYGRPGGLMPAFGQVGGGLLTEQQVDVLASGLISTWGKPGILDNLHAPGYQATLKPVPANGQKVFATYCARCHGANGTGEGGDVKGSIVDPAFLALISNQNLRSIVIAGMNPDMPNFQEQDPDHPLTDQNVTDIVAWLSAQRPNSIQAGTSAAEPESTQPHASSTKVKHEPSGIRGVAR